MRGSHQTLFRDCLMSSNDVEIPLWIYTLPFVRGGRDKGGVDCWGLLVILYKELMGLDISLKESVDCLDLEGLQKLQERFYEVVEPCFGDTVLLNNLGKPVHVGFVLNGTEMIHTATENGAVIENFKGAKWRRKVVGFYRTK